MEHRAIHVGILLPIIFVFISHAQKDDFPLLKSPYLGQKPPDMTPELLAAGGHWFKSSPRYYLVPLVFLLFF